MQLLCLVLWGLTWQAAPVELSFVIPQDEALVWQGVIQRFEASHPHIRITPVTDPTETYTTDQREAIYTADFQADVPQHDLVYMDLVWTQQFVENLMDLNELEGRGSANTDFLETELALGRGDGTGVYRLPMRTDVGVLLYRQDLLEQAGLSLPKTLEELNQAIATLKQSTNADLGYLWQGRSYEGLVVNFVEVLNSFGGTWIEDQMGKDATVGLDQPEAIAAAALLRQLIQDKTSPPIVTDYTELSSLAAFEQGRAAFLRGWPAFWAVLQRQDWGEQVAIAPPFAFGPNPGRGCRGGWGFGIPKHAAHPEEAWEAIQYLTSEAAQKQFVLDSGFLPSRRSLFTDPDIIAKYPFMPQMLEALDQASTMRPVTARYAAASDILQTALGKILRGQQSVEQAMAEAQTATEILMAQ